ncbi:HEPN domain-containing protein [Candidatus Saganbacteria bacterium]|nr:HEPN domain-containing protein [Candidatus Saganbacteria bacterium]
MQEEIDKWIRQADHDLKMAKSILEDGGYDICAFLCQQAAEKYLKALYINKRQKAAPKIHYLDELGKELNCPQDIMDLLKELSADYMIARYPDVTTSAPFEEYSKEDAQNKISKADTIIGWVKKQITI